MQAVESFLVPVEGVGVTVLASGGTEERAAAIGRRTADAHGWLSELLGLEPPVRVAALGPADWPRVTDFPVFGFPHFVGDDLIVVGSEPAPFFQGLASAMEPQLSPEDLRAMKEAYGDPPEVGAFSDLLAIHELGHLFHTAAGFWFPQRWLSELFANLCLEGWVRERQPQELAQLQTFTRCFAGIDSSAFPFTELDKMAEVIEQGPMGPMAYAWYECVLHSAAARMWDVAGADVLVRLHQRFRDADDVPDLREALAADVHPVFGELIDGWPEWR